MRNLTIEISKHLRVDVRFSYLSYGILIDFKFWKFFVIFAGFKRDMRKIMGLCRFHVYYMSYYIFHWCDSCMVPRIRGVNLDPKG